MGGLGCIGDNRKPEVLIRQQLSKAELELQTLSGIPENTILCLGERTHHSLPGGYSNCRMQIRSCTEKET